MIRRRMIIAFSMFVLFFIVQGLVFVGLSHSAAADLGVIANEEFPSLNILGRIEAAALRVQVEALAITTMISASDKPIVLDWDALQQQAANRPVEEMETGDETELLAEIQSEATQFLAAANLTNNLVDSYADLKGDAGDEGALDALRSETAAIYDEGLALINLAASGGDIAEDLPRLEAAEARLESVVSEVRAKEQAELDTLAASTHHIVSVLSVVTLVLTFGTAGMALLIGRTVGRSLINRIEHMQSLAKAVEVGRLDVRADGTAPGEIGDLQHAFNRMLDSLQARDRELAAVNAQLAERVVETEEARASAERSNQVKSAFLASMSHELRTPLNAVINFTRFVLDGDTGPINDQQAELLSEVVTSGKHLLNLINDVLDMSKIEAGSLNLFIEDHVDLEEMLKNLEATGRSLLIDKPVTLRTEIDSDLPPIRGDRQRILQILLNMVSNACKFTEEGEVTLRAYERDGEIVMEVEDTGPGIAPEDQAMVFEAFKQTRTGLRQGGGTGLGMPIARNLAEAHGGRLWLESEPGHGSTFYVALPLALEAEMVAVV